MALVVDDHLLIDLLAEDARGWLAEAVEASVVYTTASWYYRVANAAGRGSGSGSLSGRIATMPAPMQLVVRDRIARLPESIELIGRAGWYRSWPDCALPEGSTTSAPRPWRWPY